MVLWVLLSSDKTGGCWLVRRRVAASVVTLRFAVNELLVPSLLTAATAI